MLKRIRELLGRRGGKSAAAVEPTTSADPGLAPAATPVAPPSPPAAPGKGPVIHHGSRVVHHPIDRADLDPDAVKIVQRLTRFQYNAYLVGGCVRDLLLERKPKDFDLGTSATPRQIRRVFRNCRIIGRRFRLAHIYFQNGKIIEVATFRATDGQDPDAGESDSRDLLIRDDNTFGTPEEDALRRDFTINSLFYDLNDETVLDYTDGLGDLRRRLVRTIGDPGIRFREDPIRMLRAIKFAARLDFTIEPGTLEALRRNRGELAKAAPPRILEEIHRFVREGAARRSFELLAETGLLQNILPEVQRERERDAENWEWTLDLLRHMDEERFGRGPDVRLGEVFAILLLPIAAARLGWGRTDGHGSEVDPREAADDDLRPMALRLRIPRREQEHCRQILSTLLHMVPANGIRRGMKRSILSRECLAEALWMLDVTARRRGGEFAASRDHWAGAARHESPGSPRGQERPVDAGTAAGASGPRRTRRRSRRRGQAVPESTAPAAAAPARGRELPPPWDDNYFFAALPSAPELSEDSAPVERTAEPPQAAEAETPPRRKRRRGRRRRRGAAEIGATQIAPEEIVAEDEDLENDAAENGGS